MSRQSTLLMRYGKFTSHATRLALNVAENLGIVVVSPQQCVNPAGPTTPQINVVLNWFEELKPRVPVK